MLARPKPLWNFAYSTLKANFCPDCGAILDIPAAGDNVVCQFCKYTCSVTDLESKPIVTTSRKYQGTTKKHHKKDKKQEQQRALVDYECPECSHPRMYFHTMQLRSADEGQTVFYECEKCGYTFNQNT